MADFKQEQKELKAKLDIMTILQCGLEDVNWLGEFLKSFGISIQAISMFGTTFNDIVKGVYSEALKRAGLTSNDPCVKINLNMAKSTLFINEIQIYSLSDLRQASLGLVDPNSVPKGITIEDIAQVMDQKIAELRKEMSDSHKGIIAHVDNKFDGSE